MSTFSEILNEKLKKQEISSEEIPSESTLGVELLKWLNSSPRFQKSYYKVEQSSYSIYKKDSQELERQKKEKEEKAFVGFLSQISSEKHRSAAQFLYTQGARCFMDMTITSLKKDYKRLALKLHPDRHFNESPSVQRQYQDDFRRLFECYESLKTLVFSR